MRVVGVTEFGGPEVLGVHEVPTPEAGAGQVRIRVHAATVNPTDTVHRSGLYAERLLADPPPYVPGMEAAGVLDQIGPDTHTDLTIGDRVMAIMVPRGTRGAYAEYVALAADSVTRAPTGTTHAEAATLPMNGLTARLTLDTLALAPGATVAVTGAAGAYGGYVVQLAVADGLHVIADASDADEALVAGLGAHTVVRRGDDVADRIREVVADGVDAVVDGSVQQELLLPAVRDGGGFASVRGWTGIPTRDITFHPVMVTDYLHARERLDTLRRQVEAGDLTLRVARTYPAEQAAEAHRRFEAGGVRGRLVIEL